MCRQPQILLSSMIFEYFMWLHKSMPTCYTYASCVSLMWRIRAMHKPRMLTLTVSFLILKVHHIPICTAQGNTCARLLSVMPLA